MDPALLERRRFATPQLAPVPSYSRPGHQVYLSEPHRPQTRDVAMDDNVTDLTLRETPEPARGTLLMIAVSPRPSANLSTPDKGSEVLGTSSRGQARTRVGPYVASQPLP